MTFDKPTASSLERVRPKSPRKPTSRPQTPRGHSRNASRSSFQYISDVTADASAAGARSTGRSRTPSRSATADSLALSGSGKLNGTLASRDSIMSASSNDGVKVYAVGVCMIASCDLATLLTLCHHWLQSSKDKSGAKGKTGRKDKDSSARGRSFAMDLLAREREKEEQQRAEREAKAAQTTEERKKRRSLLTGRCCLGPGLIVNLHHGYRSR